MSQTVHYVHFFLRLFLVRWLDAPHELGRVIFVGLAFLHLVHDSVSTFAEFVQHFVLPVEMFTGFYRNRFRPERVSIIFKCIKTLCNTILLQYYNHYNNAFHNRSMVIIRTIGLPIDPLIHYVPRHVKYNRYRKCAIRTWYKMIHIDLNFKNVSELKKKYYYFLK